MWEQAQAKVAAQAKKYEKVNRDKEEKIHLLSGILKCPVCGAGMYGNKAIKKRKDVSKDTLEFLGLWEQLHNSAFKGV